MLPCSWAHEIVSAYDSFTTFLWPSLFLRIPFIFCVSYFIIHESLTLLFSPSLSPIHSILQHLRGRPTFISPSVFTWGIGRNALRVLEKKTPLLSLSLYLLLLFSLPSILEVVRSRLSAVVPAKSRGALSLSLSHIHSLISSFSLSHIHSLISLSLSLSFVKTSMFVSLVPTDKERRAG